MRALILSFTRLLQVLPAGSPAYTHIYRLCSTSAQPPFPAPASASGGGSARSSPPTTLDLGLNFATMDFEAVAKATHAAITRERGLGSPALNAQRDHNLEAKLDRQSEQAAARRTPAALPPTPYPSAPASSHATNSGFQSSSHRGRSAVSGGGRGFARRDAETGAAGHQQQGVDATSTPRSSLHVLLRECAEEKNWVKAYQLFNTALRQSFRQVLIPSSDGAAAAIHHSALDSGASSTTASDNIDPQREAQCFAALRKMLSTMPPATSRDRSAPTPTRRLKVGGMRGVMRWNGQHYYMLWKALLEAGRVEEVQRVWYVMQQIGFVDSLIEERTVNTLMALLRRTASMAEQSEAQVVATAFSQTESFEERMEKEKEMRRTLMTELEQVATSHNFHLAMSNKRTAQTIRISEALRRVESAEDGEAARAESGQAPQSHAGTEDASIDVGDFNGLLRRSRSQHSTQQVLEMMAKLNLNMGSSTFASLIASLHNPQYVLEGHTAEELSTHNAAVATPARGAAAAVGDADEGSASGVAAASSSAALIDTKTQYEAYKQERVETALRWFFECPKPLRTAEVYNELLYLLRAKTHWQDFDKVLVEMRGNAVVTEVEWPEATAAPSASASADNAPVILPPAWTTPPNGKTYELLMQRARYVHQWDVMWALYEEMSASRVRGTTRLYEVLLNEASRNPPRTLRGVELQRGDARASSEALMRLYDELRRSGGDVRSFSSTMNVVNAWTKSRAKMNRWD